MRQIMLGEKSIFKELFCLPQFFINQLQTYTIFTLLSLAMPKSLPPA